MTLSSLVAESGIQPIAVTGDASVGAITQDSRQAIPGSLFVCNPGTTNDSHAFIASAKENGAAAAVVWSPEGMRLAQANGIAAIQLPKDRIQFNDAVCRLCNTFFGYPTRTMKVVGVTGTNGKTTTAWLIRDMLASLGLKAGYLGTLGFQIPGEERELGNTTPYPVELWSLLAEARDKGVEAMAMEVSSHALAEHRCEYVEFDAGVFTNLTQDHLDFHGSMEEYEAAKLRLFTELPLQTEKRFVGAINVGDGVGAKWMAGGDQGSLLGFAVDSKLENGLRVEATRVMIELLELNLFWARDGAQELFAHSVVSLGGTYNIENSAAATAGLLALGYSKRDSAIALESAKAVPGRFEVVVGKPVSGSIVLVDYAHTPDALEKLLDAVRPLTKGRVITVFGCGGDRDRTKRPKMAKAASERSDITVITSDNPRTEDPVQILKDVAAGIAGGVAWHRLPADASHDLPGHGQPVAHATTFGATTSGQDQDGLGTHRLEADATAIIDRREAIAYAIQIAKPGDVVVIAGKGHENYQIIGRTKYPMDDRLMAREALEARTV